MKTTKNSNLEINNKSVSIKLARGVLVNISGKAVGRSLYILSQVILARVLGPDGFGLYGIGWIFFRIGAILATFGLDSGVIHFSSQFWDKDKRKLSEIVFSALVSAFLIGSVIGTLIYLSAGGLAHSFNKPDLELVLRLFSYAIPALAGMTILSASTRVSKDMRKANLIEEIIFPGSTVLLIGIVYFYGGDLEDYVFGSAIAVYISLFLGLLISRTNLLKIDVHWSALYQQSKTLIKYSLPITLPILFGTLINLTDRIFTGYFLPEVDTGIYQSVSLISALFIAILSAFKTMAAPMIAENYHSGKSAELQNLMMISTRWVFNICAPVLLVFLTAPDAFIGTFFGASYLPGSQALIFLAFAQLINISKGPIDQLLIMTGNQKQWLLITLTAFGVNILSNLILIPNLGINGAAIAQLLTYLVLAAGGIMVARKKLNIFAYDRRWLIYIGISLAVVSALLGLQVIIDRGVVFQLIITGIVSLLGYFSLLFLFGLTKTEKALLWTMVQLKRGL